MYFRDGQTVFKGMLVSNAVLLFNLFTFTPDSQSFHTKEPYLCVSIRHLKINPFLLFFLNIFREDNYTLSCARTAGAYTGGLRVDTVLLISL